jgi:hypothetical protein
VNVSVGVREGVNVNSGVLDTMAARVAAAELASAVRAASVAATAWATCVSTDTAVAGLVAFPAGVLDRLHPETKISKAEMLIARILFLNMRTPLLNDEFTQS